MEVENHQCPECESEEFITQPNRYDVLTFEESEFVSSYSHFVDEYKIYCRECSEEINVETSEKEKRVIPKKLRVKKTKNKIIRLPTNTSASWRPI